MTRSHHDIILYCTGSSTSENGDSFASDSGVESEEQEERLMKKYVYGREMDVASKQDFEHADPLALWAAKTIQIKVM